MINITRPVIEGHKTVQAVESKSLDKLLKGQGNRSSNVGSEAGSDGSTMQIPKQTPNQRVVDMEQLEKAVEEANRIVFPSDNHFEFKIHDGTGRIMVKLVNKQTNETIREIPSEKILDLIANIWEMVGILVDERG